jgi:AbiU2
MTQKKKQWFEKLTREQRIELAKEKMVKVIDHFMHLLMLHANNEFVVYTPTLSSQIPTSFAANAFNIFVRSMYHFEIVRICALWDSAKPEKENITTIVELVDDHAIIETLAEHAGLPWQGNVINPSDDPDLTVAEQQAIKETDKQFGIQQAMRARTDLKAAISNAKGILNSAQLKSIMNLRDKHLAHSLTATYREKDEPVPPIKVGDETDLMKRSIPIVESLYRCVNGTSFSIEDSQMTDHENAEALWKGCKFTVLQ